jgi:hypothetical protein
MRDSSSAVSPTCEWPLLAELAQIGLAVLSRRKRPERVPVETFGVPRHYHLRARTIDPQRSASYEMEAPNGATGVTS